MLIGFNSNLSISYKKHKYMEKFFEVLPKLLNEDTKEIGKTLMEYGIPCIFSKPHLVKKLKEVIPKIKPEQEFHRRNVQKYIEDYENILRAYQLFD